MCFIYVYKLIIIHLSIDSKNQELKRYGQSIIWSNMFDMFESLVTNPIVRVHLFHT